MTAFQIPLNFSLPNAFGREDFLVTKCNFEAATWLDRFPDWQTNSLIIYGEKGCGKTHLSHIFVEKVGKEAKTPIVDARTISTDIIPELVSKTGSVVIENIDENTDEEALLHLYNFIKENKGFLLLTSLKSPNFWNIKLADLSSRINSVPSIAIGLPDDILMRALLVKMFSDRQLEIKEDALEYLIKNMERSFGSAGRIVERADKLSLAKKRGISIPILKEVMAN